MVQNVNQFNLTAEQGMMTMQVPGTVITGYVDPNITAGFIAGQAVKMVNNTTPIPTFTALTANTDKAYGFIPLNSVLSAKAGRPFEVALANSVMYMTAGAAIARNALVEVVIASNTVITAAGVNPAVGRAMDAAAANGDLIRVRITTPDDAQNT